MTAECRRLSPDHIGPTCGCADGYCVLEDAYPDEYLRRFDEAVRVYLIFMGLPVPARSGERGGGR